MMHCENLHGNASEQCPFPCQAAEAAGACLGLAEGASHAPLVHCGAPLAELCVLRVLGIEFQNQPCFCCHRRQNQAAHILTVTCKTLVL